MFTISRYTFVTGQAHLQPIQEHSTREAANRALHQIAMRLNHQVGFEAYLLHCDEKILGRATLQPSSNNLENFAYLQSLVQFISTSPARGFSQSDQDQYDFSSAEINKRVRSMR